MKIIKEQEKGNLIVISGPSGSGKGSIIKGLMDRNKNIWLSVSLTSWERRVGEEEGKDYYYTTKEDF